MTKQCPKCDTMHTKPGRFCSRSCANSRVRTDEYREKLSNIARKSEKVQQANSSRKIPRESRNCKICNTEFVVSMNSAKKFCSKACVGKHSSIVNKGKTGGYRKGSGRCNGGYYHGVYCHSSYELVWVMYNIAHKIEFKPCSITFKYGTGGTYKPDFILADGTIVEIKGYHTAEVDLKAQSVIDSGYQYQILYRNDLQYCFDWVKRAFPNKKVSQLYDDYKPSYTYTCDYCGNNFDADKPRTGVLTFCSRRCGGKHKPSTI